MRLRHGLLVILTATIAATTGCGGEATAPAIDISKLDSGNYPTTPRDIEAIRTSRSGAALESVRIGSATPLPLDVDGRLSFQRRTNVDRRITPESPPASYSLSDAEWADLSKGFIAGWETSAERRGQPSLGKQVQMELFRFPTSSEAEAAARRLADRQAANLSGDPVQITGFPQARAKWSVSKKYLDAWLADETTLLYVHAEDPVSEPAEPTSLIEFTQKYFSKQIEMLKSYVPTPVDQLGSLPIDVDGLLSRTLPLEDKEKRDKSYDQSMVLAGQAALHSEPLPAVAKAAFANAGVDFVSYSGAQVYRTKDTEGTTRLIAAFIDGDAAGYNKIDSPPNLPVAQCFDDKDPKSFSIRYPPVCFFAYDRYVARVTGHNTQELYQRTAAQYKLLTY